MSNVIHLNVPSHRQSKAESRSALLASFAQHRRFGDDVFWLKENAELLNILECTGLPLADQALAAHEGFYDQVEKRLGFFPQYYRFLLSICLDLEDLGMAGTKGEALCVWVAEQGLAEAELSDLQRAEARRLMQRRGVEPLPHDIGLTDRLHRFIDRSETFAMPNKKAAYELTHIVFYLSEYGRRDPHLSARALISLEYAGILAYLDQNADLLAEVCVALRFAGQTPSPIWEDWLAGERQEILTRRAAIEEGFPLLAAKGWKLLGCGAYFAYVEHPFAASSDEIARRLVSELSVLALPGTMFQPPDDPAGHRQFRIAFANIDAAEITLLFRRLAAFQG